ncbi:unnamed protein product [Bemisia tabaci]|uniref:Uncharacterized protein n=1 Tax=Bemisia tabaci TaxID=7038 RepID=A0A9P0F0P3_BEMTA|nr:unnamed protein product [Bemisia tabaci]
MFVHTLTSLSAETFANRFTSWFTNRFAITLTQTGQISFAATAITFSSANTQRFGRISPVRPSRTKSKTNTPAQDPQNPPAHSSKPSTSLHKPQISPDIIPISKSPPRSSPKSLDESPPKSRQKPLPKSYQSLCKSFNQNLHQNLLRQSLRQSLFQSLCQSLHQNLRLSLHPRLRPDLHRLQHLQNGKVLIFIIGELMLQPRMHHNHNLQSLRYLQHLHRQQNPPPHRRMFKLNLADWKRPPKVQEGLQPALAPNVDPNDPHQVAFYRLQTKLLKYFSHKEAPPKNDFLALLEDVHNEQFKPRSQDAEQRSKKWIEEHCGPLLEEDRVELIESPTLKQECIIRCHKLWGFAFVPPEVTPPPVDPAEFFACGRLVRLVEGEVKENPAPYLNEDHMPVFACNCKTAYEFYLLMDHYEVNSVSFNELRNQPYTSVQYILDWLKIAFYGTRVQILSHAEFMLQWQQLFDRGGGRIRTPLIRTSTLSGFRKGKLPVVRMTSWPMTRIGRVCNFRVRKHPLMD